MPEGGKGRLSGTWGGAEFLTFSCLFWKWKKKVLCIPQVSVNKVITLKASLLLIDSGQQDKKKLLRVWGFWVSEEGSKMTRRKPGAAGEDGSLRGPWPGLGGQSFPAVWLSVFSLPAQPQTQSPVPPDGDRQGKICLYASLQPSFTFALSLLAPWSPFEKDAWCGKLSTLQGSSRVLIIVWIYGYEVLI